MPPKGLPSEFPVLRVKKLVMELEADSNSFVTLRVKRDRRQAQMPLPAALERRGELGVYVKKPASK
jgi:hypothetical protein